MGLSCRADFGLLMNCHFPPLAARNTLDMRWKPFFWREIELAEGIDCRAATPCARCRHHAHCFGPEQGASLILDANLP